MANALNLSGLEGLSHPDAKPMFTSKPPEWVATYLPRYCFAASDRAVDDCRGLAVVVKELHRDNFWQTLFPDWETCCQALFKRPAAWVAQVVEGVRMLHGLGHKGAIGAALALKATQTQPLAAHGAIGNGRKDKSRVDNVHSKPANQLNSNSWDRILPRLARDAPEVLEKVKTGEIKSARAAAIEAGIIKPVPTVRLVADMAVVASKLCQHLTQQQRLELIDLLAPDL